MGAFPVDTLAARAYLKLLEVAPRAWLQLLGNIFLTHFFEGCIALHAPGKHINHTFQVETDDHLLQLLPRIL